MTTRLRVDVAKRLGSFDLRVQLEVGTETLVIFGPSGAGKTQTLQLIAGLTQPDAGEITLDGEVFARRQGGERPILLPARKRRVGYVFQQYALFPHLSALDNVAFPLRKRPDRHVRARALLERMRLDHLAERFPHELSGGQQQRVAIARALAAEPRVLLLDEPFSALDLAIRERLHADLAELQREAGLIVIYVTHNLEDAFAVGHRLAVMRAGRIEQIGPLDDVVRRPNSAAVLQILGIPNIIHARVRESSAAGLTLDWDGLTLEAMPQDVPAGALVTAYIRPEDIKILYPDRPVASAVRHNQVTGRVSRVQRGPTLQTIEAVLPNGHMVEISFPTYAYLPLRLLPGAPIRLSLRREGLMLLPIAVPESSSQPPESLHVT